MKSSPMACRCSETRATIAGRVLDPGNVLQFEQTLHGVDRHVDHRARRNIVDDDRDADRVVHRLEVVDHALLGRLVVIGRDHQHGVGAGLLAVPRKRDRLRRRVGAGAGDHRHPAAGLIDAPLHHLVMLRMRQRRAFAGGPTGNEAVGALGDLPLDEVAERLFVELAVAKRRHQSGERPPELSVSCHVSTPDDIVAIEHCESNRRDKSANDGFAINSGSPRGLKANVLEEQASQALMLAGSAGRAAVSPFSDGRSLANR